MPARIIAIAALALTAPSSQTARMDEQDWLSVVVRTSEGGMRMGNPDAPVKVVEYCSRTGPVCAEFAAASGRLRSVYVASGKVSLEYRDFMLNPQDETATLLGQCVEDDKFFPVLDQMFDHAPEIYRIFQTFSDARFAELDRMSPAQLRQALARDLGLVEIMKRNGMSESAIEACLVDARMLRVQAARQNAAAEAGVVGTPTFLINGREHIVVKWADLEPLLKAAGA